MPSHAVTIISSNKQIKGAFLSQLFSLSVYTTTIGFSKRKVVPLLFQSMTFAKKAVLWEDFKLEDKHDDDATTVMLLLWYGKGSHNYYTAKQRPKGWGWDYCCCLFHREKGELELVVVVLISDLSQHCVLRGPKRRGLTEAARLLLVVVRGRGYHDITLGLTLLKISFEHFSLGYFPKTSQFIEPRKVSMGLFYIPNLTLTDWYVLSVQVPCLDYLQLQT